MFRRLLVASDLTAQSQTALSLAHRLSIETGAAVSVIHVVEMAAILRPFAGPTFRTDLANYRALLERQIGNARKELQAQAERAGMKGRDVSYIVRAGLPSAVIVAVVDEIDADLIVIGRGREGRLGPVAEHTVRLVGRSVLVAPVHRKARAQRCLPSSSRASVRRLRAVG